MQPNLFSLRPSPALRAVVHWMQAGCRGYSRLGVDATLHRYLLSFIRSPT